MKPREVARYDLKTLQGDFFMDIESWNCCTSNPENKSWYFLNILEGQIQKIIKCPVSNNGVRNGKNPQKIKVQWTFIRYSRVRGTEHTLLVDPSFYRVTHIELYFLEWYKLWLYFLIRLRIQTETINLGLVNNWYLH